jgi:hypothetical protein
MAIFMGVFPNVFLKPMEASVSRSIERVIGPQPATAALQPQSSPAPPRQPSASGLAEPSSRPPAHDGRQTRSGATGSAGVSAND